MMLGMVSTFAHYLWIETNPDAELNKPHEIRVYFGEYTYGVNEKVESDAFKSVNQFTVWVVDAAGNETKLTLTPTEDYYIANFTPKSEGTHTVILNNDNIDVIDYTQYDFGIFKTHYHAMASFQVGSTRANTIAQNKTGITLKRINNDSGEVKLQVLYKNTPLANVEVAIYVADLWSKKLESDESGFVSFNLPWETKYIVEVTNKEDVPGHYNSKDYEFIWQCVSYCINPSL